MKEDFHDKFTDIQGDIISLCLELINNNADGVYAYSFTDKHEIMFNAFFVQHGKVKMLDELGVDFDTAMEFLDIGSNDLHRILDLCKENDVNPPVEMKMIYDNKTGEFSADYDYSKKITDNKTAYDLFVEWCKEIKEKF